MHDALMHHPKLQINQEIEKTSEHVHLFKNIAFEPCLGSLITLLDSNFSTQIPCDSHFVSFFLSFLFAPHYLNCPRLDFPSFFSFDTRILVILALLVFYVFFVVLQQLASCLHLGLVKLKGVKKACSLGSKISKYCVTNKKSGRKCRATVPSKFKLKTIYQILMPNVTWYENLFFSLIIPWL